MLVKLIPCKTCGLTFERHSHKNKLCKDCVRVITEQRIKAYADKRKEQAANPSPQTYTIVDKDDRLLGFLRGHTKEEVEAQMTKGQFIYREPIKVQA